MCNTVAVTETSKGHRVWIQGLQGKGITGDFVLVTFGPDKVTLCFGNTKLPKWRKVTQSKGGIVDLQSRKVTQWANGATLATTEVDTQAQTITLARAN